MSRLGLLYAVLLSAVILIPASLAAQDPGDVARLREVAAQALEKEVREGLAAAKTGSDLTGNANKLKALLKKVDGDDNLSIVQKASLRNSLNERIRLLEDPAARAAADAEQRRSEDLHGQLEKLNAEQAQSEGLRRQLEQLRILRERGQDAEAQRLGAELAKRYPDNPAVQQAQTTTAIAANVREASAMLAMKAHGALRTGNEVVRSSTPLPDDITYPKDWAQMSKRRQEAYLKKLSPMSDKEREIVRSLNEVVKSDTDLKDMTFDKVIEYLQNLIGQPIFMNKDAMKDLELEYEKRITVRVPRNVTKRTILRSVLAEVGLTYVVRGESIHVTDPERAKGMLVTRFFMVDDLLQFAGNLGFGNSVDKTPADQLVDMIQDSIDPLSWQKNGGPGTITIQGKILIVKNTAEVINMLGGSRLR